ncbi:MAG: SBBP repeat-containing protein [Acidobacteria bacterium]|nr:SBBP repeat-containing protein [Acidobacteriota bacterium]
MVALLMTLAALALHPAPFSGATLPGKVQAASPLPASPVKFSWDQIPLIFEVNQGQTNQQVKFLARGAGYGLFLTANEAVLSLRQADAKKPASVVRMQLADANPAPKVEGRELLPGKSNYFVGKDPSRWHRGIAQFGRVHYSAVYPGIDLAYYGNQGKLEYDFIVAPGADPQHVVLHFDGAEKLALEANGDLRLLSSNGDVRLHAPLVYQEAARGRQVVPAKFALLAGNRVGFAVGAYDRTRTLVIDPVLTYSSYLGGSGAEACSVISGAGTPQAGCPAIAVDTVLTPDLYVAGSTTSADFPPQPGIVGSLSGTANVYVIKFQPTGTSYSVAFATYLGGSGVDLNAGVAVGSNFDVFVAGTTTSGDFPTTPNAYQSSPAASGKHAFLSRFNANGNLAFSTYLSGTGTETATGLAVDNKGKAYVTGSTTSTDFPTTPAAFQTASLAPQQLFLSKIDPTLAGTSSLVYSTYFGGGTVGTGDAADGVAIGGGVAVDSSGNVYFTGGTNFLHTGDATHDFPILNAAQGCLNAWATKVPTTPATCSSTVTALDAFVAKFAPVTTAATTYQLVYSNYVGGSGDDIGRAIAVDSGGNAYITGSTTSSDLTAATSTTPYQGTYGGGASDAFLAKISSLTLSSTTTSGNVSVLYFSYLGGSGADAGLGIAVDSAQGARIVGWTNSTNFVPSGIATMQATSGGGQDAFAARIDTTATSATAAGHYATYLGGSGSDAATSLALDSRGSSYLAGETASGNFPLSVSPNLIPYQGSRSGASDAFVASLGPTTNLSILGTGSPSPVGVGNQVSFRYVITNNGDLVTGVTFTDNLGSFSGTIGTAISSNGSCGTAAQNVVLCNVGTLTAGQVATVTVNVTPNTAGVLSNSGTLTVTGAPFTVTPNPPPSVTVNDFAVSADPPSITQPAGVPASYTVTVTPTGAIPSSVSLSCSSGLPTGAACSFTNTPISNLNSGSAASRALIINTTARVTTTSQVWPKNGFMYATWLPVSGLAFLGLGMGTTMSRKRRIALGLLLGSFLTLTLFAAGCGSSSTTTTTTGTPAGTYTVTVTATSGSASRTSTVNLVVQ